MIFTNQDEVMCCSVKLSAVICRPVVSSESIMILISEQLYQQDVWAKMCDTNALLHSDVACG